MNVNITDPTYAVYPGLLYTGWYLGVEGQDAVHSVATVIAKIQDRLGIPNENVVIIGSSAGGTSALQIASAIPGSTAIAENPPIYPQRRTSAKAFKAAGIDLESDLLLNRNNLSHIFDHPTSRFFIFQNALDRGVVSQLEELFHEVGLQFPGVGLSKFGAVQLYLTSVPARSPHDTFMSVTEMRSVLAVLESETPAEIQMVTLDAAYESLRERIRLQDNLSNLKVWSRLIGEIDHPALSLTGPTDGVVYRLPLRTRPDVVYCLRLNFNLKAIYISVTVGPQFTSASRKDLEQFATAAGAELVQPDKEPILRISNTPVAKVADRLARFVDSTAELFLRDWSD